MKGCNLTTTLSRSPGLVSPRPDVVWWGAGTCLLQHWNQAWCFQQHRHCPDTEAQIEDPQQYSKQLVNYIYKNITQVGLSCPSFLQGASDILIILILHEKFIGFYLLSVTTGECFVNMTGNNDKDIMSTLLLWLFVFKLCLVRAFLPAHLKPLSRCSQPVSPHLV